MVRQLTITAELVGWSLDDERNNVSGMISNSRDPDWYRNGEQYTFINVRHITQMQDYILVCTQIGNYFKCYRSEMK